MVHEIGHVEQPVHDPAAIAGDMRSERRILLRDIVRRFGNQLALNADVVRAGTIRIGDPVRLVVPEPLTSVATSVQRSENPPAPSA